MRKKIDNGVSRFILMPLAAELLTGSENVYGLEKIPIFSISTPSSVTIACRTPTAFQGHSRSLEHTRIDRLPMTSY